ncbi:unnamed protein product [Thelazia callipaeda]|uniref:Uncharacterized protein n=1 Tax=Thelazia callipaeda TaxID=103827 RepID=A0A0N5D1S5_THECL|nr:unnamed protein product [Thelazia callipaeda]
MSVCGMRDAFNIEKDEIDDEYLQRVQKVQRIINNSKLAQRKKKYKCIEVDVNNVKNADTYHMDSWKNFLNYPEKTTFPLDYHVRYERPKLRQVFLESPMNTLSATSLQPSLKTIIEAPPAVYATGFSKAPLRSHNTAGPPRMRETLESPSTIKPPLILSPEHCKQV